MGACRACRGDRRGRPTFWPRARLRSVQPPAHPQPLRLASRPPPSDPGPSTTLTLAPAPCRRLCRSQLLRQDGGRHVYPEAGPGIHQPGRLQGKPGRGGGAHTHARFQSVEHCGRHTRWLLSLQSCMHNFGAHARRHGLRGPWGRPSAGGKRCRVLDCPLLATLPGHRQAAAWAGRRPEVWPLVRGAPLQLGSGRRRAARQQGACAPLRCAEMRRGTLHPKNKARCCAACRCAS